MFRRLFDLMTRREAARIDRLIREVSDDEVAEAIRSVPIHLAMMTLGRDCKITRVKNSASAGTTDLDSDRVDGAGFDSAIFLWLLGDVTSGSVLQAIFKSNPADSASSSTTEKSGTSITAGASNYDNLVLAVDVHRPTYRYWYSTLVIDTQNAVVDGCIAIQYNARTLPITQGATIGDLVFGGPHN